MLTLVPETAEILTQKMPDFDFSGNIDCQKLFADMIETMRFYRGAGLAAPQCGLNYRVFVMETEVGKRACFNPEIISVSETVFKHEEGCLSFPDLWLQISRPEIIEVRYINENEKIIHEKFANFSAAVYAHESDHLNGVRFIDKIGPMALMTAKKRREKFLKGKQNG